MAANLLVASLSFSPSSPENEREARSTTPALSRYSLFLLRRYTLHLFAFFVCARRSRLNSCELPSRKKERTKEGGLLHSYMEVCAPFSPSVYFCAAKIIDISRAFVTLFEYCENCIMIPLKYYQRFS